MCFPYLLYDFFFFVNIHCPRDKRKCKLSRVNAGNIRSASLRILSYRFYIEYTRLFRYDAFEIGTSAPIFVHTLRPVIYSVAGGRSLMPHNVIYSKKQSRLLLIGLDPIPLSDVCRHHSAHVTHSLRRVFLLQTTTDYHYNTSRHIDNNNSYCS